MKKDKLAIKHNPYLQDPEAFGRALCRNVESSSAIEGIKLKVHMKKQKNGDYQFTPIVEK